MSLTKFPCKTRGQAMVIKFLINSYLTVVCKENKNIVTLCLGKKRGSLEISIIQSVCKVPLKFSNL
jgi:hypothetical protein